MMKLKSISVALLALALGVSSCSNDDDDNPTPPQPKEGQLSGQITGTRTLSADTVYTMNGYLRVMAGGTLNIPAGTIIKGTKSPNKAALIVERGGKIYAKGTKERPIIFTSSQPKGSRAIGDWAGVIICGKAKVNTPGGTATYEGGVLGNGVAEYGGNDNADNSGEFYYVRIEYAGDAIETNKEINGLTLCGVGSGTTVHHVQVSYGGDDSFEMFGGTVNMHHLIAYSGTDDDFDIDNGYTGSIQYAISIKDPNIADAAGTSRGIECENKGSVTDNLFSKPLLSNFTIVGPGNAASVNAKHGATATFSGATRFVLRNSIIVNSRIEAVQIDGAEPAKSLKDGDSEFSHNLVFAAGGPYVLANAGGAFVDAAALKAFLDGKTNAILADLNAAGITKASNVGPNLTLKAESPAKTGANFDGVLATGFEKVAYRGAMDTEDWTSGWANWDPNNADY